MKIYMAYTFGIFFIGLIIARLISKKYQWSKREISAYSEFKKSVFSKPDQNVVLIPGTNFVFSPSDVIALEHCQRFLINNSSKISTINANILVSCPFKYEILKEFTDKNSIKANVELISPISTGFTLAAMGVIGHTKPSVTFINNPYGYESILIGEASNAYGINYQAAADTPTLCNAAIVAKQIIMCEEMFALPAYEEEHTIDKIFLIASDIFRLIIIIIIVFGSIKATIPQILLSLK